MEAPIIKQELLDWLRRLFPGNIGEDILEHQHYAYRSGQENVVGRIEREFERQNQ